MQLLLSFIASSRFYPKPLVNVKHTGNTLPPERNQTKFHAWEVKSKANNIACVCSSRCLTTTSANWNDLFFFLNNYPTCQLDSAKCHIFQKSFSVRRETTTFICVHTAVMMHVAIKLDSIRLNRGHRLTNGTICWQAGNHPPLVAYPLLTHQGVVVCRVLTPVSCPRTLSTQQGVGAQGPVRHRPNFGGLSSLILSVFHYQQTYL